MNSRLHLISMLFLGLFFSSMQVLAAPPPNDIIGAATPIGSNIGFVVGTTIDAGIDDANQIESLCNLPIDSPGVWYSVQGAGREITAKTCDDSVVYTPYDTKLTIFTLNENGGLVCQVANDDFCGLQSEVSWDAEADQKYYILVHGFNATGDFRLFVSGQGDAIPAQKMVTEAIPALGLPGLLLMSAILTGVGGFFSRKSETI